MTCFAALAQASCETLGQAAPPKRLGFHGIDLGSLSVGGRLVQFPGGPLPGQNFVRFG